SPKPRRSIPALSIMRLRDRHSRPRANLAMVPRSAAKGLRRSLPRTHVPILAIGGLNVTRAAEVLALGPASIAVMGGVMRAADPKQEIKALLATVTGARR